ncbi:MAG TPA: hypothetical protein PLS84_06330 [Salinivirgaceae bacterium]|nr:hypothetical protein [Salinivirgaceae bacterium]
MKYKFYILPVILIFITAPITLANEKIKSADINHRVTIGNYNSFWPDNIGIIEGGYDFVVNFPYLTQEYNLLDFGLGLSSLFAFDQTGNPRTPVLGFGVNGSIRMYTPSILKARLFIESVMSLVVYSKDYPANGTQINGGWHFGGGINYKNIFAKVLWFHTSNNDIYGRERNPSINALGFAFGIQL